MKALAKENESIPILQPPYPNPFSLFRRRGTGFKVSLLKRERDFGWDCNVRYKNLFYLMLLNY
jgi:hypothetical protein